MKMMLYFSFIAIWMLMTFAIPRHFAPSIRELPSYDHKEIYAAVQNRTEHEFLYSGMEIVKVNIMNFDGKGYYRL